MNNLPQLKEGQSLTDYKKQLKDWKPTTADQATGALHLISLINAVSGDIKKASYKALDGFCNGCETMEGKTNGLTVLKVTPQSKVYNETEDITTIQFEIDARTAELVDLKADLKAAQLKGGHTLVSANKDYWKAI
jgi:hypothetical protein